MKIKIGYINFPDRQSFNSLDRLGPRSIIPLDHNLVDIEYVQCDSIDLLEQCDILVVLPECERTAGNPRRAGLFHELKDRLLKAITRDDEDPVVHASPEWSDEELTKEFYPILFEFFIKAKELNIPIAYFDLLYPRQCEMYNSMYDCVVTEPLYPQQQENVLGMPMLGIENLRSLLLLDSNHMSTVPTGYDYHSIFTLFKPELINRPYDAFLRVGKCDDPLRQLIVYEFISANLHNSSHTITTTEMNGGQRRRNEARLFEALLYRIFQPDGGPHSSAYRFNFHDMKNFFEKINLGKTKEHDEKHTWAQFTQEQIEEGNRGNPLLNIPSEVDRVMNTGYTCNNNTSIVPTFISCAEISFESITGRLHNFDKRDENFACLTEKHLQMFYSLTIPLIIDNSGTINYLKSMGFEFIIDPCVIDIDRDEYLDTEWTQNLRQWMEYLKTQDFRALWDTEISFGRGRLLYNFDVLIDYLINDLHKTLLTYKFFAKINRNDKFTRILDTYSSDRNIKKLIGYGCDVSL